MASACTASSLVSGGGSASIRSNAVAVVAREAGYSAEFHKLITGADPELANAFVELEQLGDERAHAARAVVSPSIRLTN